jgi:hypothetical protein
VVLAQAGQRHRKALGETRVLGALPAGQLVEFQPRDANRRRSEDVRAAEVTHVFEPHLDLLQISDTVVGRLMSQAQYRA